VTITDNIKNDMGWEIGGAANWRGGAGGAEGKNQLVCFLSRRQFFPNESAITPPSTPPSQPPLPVAFGRVRLGRPVNRGGTRRRQTQTRERVPKRVL
jgi:hypothetical protein